MSLSIIKSFRAISPALLVKSPPIEDISTIEFLLPFKTNSFFSQQKLKQNVKSNPEISQTQIHWTHKFIVLFVQESSTDILFEFAIDIIWKITSKRLNKFITLTIYNSSLQAIKLLMNHLRRLTKNFWDFSALTLVLMNHN